MRWLSLAAAALVLATGCRPEAAAPSFPPGDAPARVDPGQYRTTDTGLKYFVLQEGSGDVARTGQRVRVHYTGWLQEGGKHFDSSHDRGEPIEFTLGAGRVIPGWDQGVEGMKVGEKRQLVIPPDLGYGAEGTPGGPIPPNATLIFDVELVSVEEA